MLRLTEKMLELLLSYLLSTQTYSAIFRYTRGYSCAIFGQAILSYSIPSKLKLTDNGGSKSTRYFFKRRPTDLSCCDMKCQVEFITRCHRAG